MGSRADGVKRMGSQTDGVEGKGAKEKEGKGAGKGGKGATEKGPGSIKFAGRKQTELSLAPYPPYPWPLIRAPYLPYFLEIAK